MQLAIIFAPIEHESSLGYYRRLAAHNALWHWKELAKMAEVSPSRSGLLGQPHYMASALGLDLQWTVTAAQQEQAARAWRSLHRNQHDAVCPKCLEESVHLHGYWEHGYAVACHKHGVELIDRCEACGELLSTTREKLELCQCGHDLRTHTCKSATPAQRWLAQQLAHAEGSGSFDAAPEISGVEVTTLSKLVRTLCLLHDPKAAHPPRNAATPNTVSEAIEFLRPLDLLLQDWPRGFEAHVKDRIAAGTPEARTLNSLLGRWYLQLKALTATGPLRPFLDAVLRVAAVEFDGVVGLDTSDASASQGITHVLLKDVTQRTGVSRDGLMKLIHQNLLTYRTKRFGTRGLVYEVPVSEVERLQTSRAQWMGQSEACQLLGVHTSVFEHMAAAQLLLTDKHWRDDPFKSGPVHRASLQGLVDKMLGLEVQAAKGEELIALSELTTRRMGDKAAIQSAMKAIYSGDVRPGAPAKQVGKLQFRLADVKQYFGTPMLEHGLAVNQLSKKTGWKWESISHWIEQGLLESETISLRGQPCRVVTPDHLLRFTQQFIPLADLARNVGSKSSVLMDQLDVELLGGKPLPNGMQRGALVRVSDLTRLALRGSTTQTPALTPA